MGTQPIRVLCTCEDSRYADRVEAILARADGGFTVAVEPDVREGRRRLRNEEFDCIVSVLSGPGPPELPGALAGADRDVPLVLVTADGSAERLDGDVDAAVELARLDRLASRVRLAVRDRRTEFDRERFVAVARDAVRAAVRSTTRSELEDAVCAAVHDSELYGAAWIGDYDAERGELLVRASAGEAPESSVPLALEPDALDRDGELATVGVRDGERRTGGPSGRNATDETRRESRPVAVAPLSAGDERYGVLAVVPDGPRTLRETERAELGELATDVAHAMRSGRAGEPPGETAERLRTVIEASPNAIVALDPNGRVRLWNPAAEELFGWCESEALGETMPMVPPDRRDEFDGLSGGKTYAGEEVRCRTKAGEQRRCSLSTAKLRDEAGDPSGTVAVFEDVTERKRRERELTESRQRYRTLAEHFPDGAVVLFDDDLHVRIARGRGLETMDEPPEELEGCSLEEHVPDEVRGRLEPQFRGALAGETDTVDVSLGGHHYRVQTLPVENDGGEVFAGMAVVQDVTGQVERERELEESRRRYRALVEAAPDPIFVADAETGRIVEVNRQAERVTGRPADELVGLHQSELHPPECRQEYAELFTLHREELGRVDGGTTVRQLADGEDVFVATSDGDRVPVEITSSLLESGGSTYLQAIFRNVSDRKEYERTLKALSEATQRFYTAESRAEVCEVVVDIATSVLDLAIVGVHLFDKDNSALPPIAYSLGPGDDFGEPPTVEPGNKAAWEVFTRNERAVFEDVGGDPGAFEPDTPLGSAILTPIEGIGVLVVGDDETGGFDDRLVELVEILAGTAREAIHRVTREQHLRERESTLERQTARLERLDDVNRQIRRVLDAAVRANTREEIETEVCDRLVETDRFSFAWIASVDSTHDRLVPEVWAGRERGYLDVLDMSIDGRPDGPPEIRTAVSRETTVVEYVTDRIQDERWRQETFARGFESAIAIPLELGEVMHGVLTIYADQPDAFDDISRDVLVELGQTIAYAIGSIEQRRSILMNRAVELEFEISDDRCLWKQVAERTGDRFEVLSTVPHGGDTTIAFLELEEGSPDRFRECLEDHPTVIEAEVVGDGTGRTARVVLGQTSVARTLVEVGGQVTRREVNPSGVRLHVKAPPDVDVRSVVSLVESRYPDFRLVSRRETTRQPSQAGDDDVLDGLTQRQREVLEVAYFNGYFGWPRDVTIEELADVFDVASSTLSRHLRVAQRKLLGNVFAEFRWG